MSLAFHRVHPERVSALLIIDTGPGFKNDEAREGLESARSGLRQPFRGEGLAYLRTLSPEMAMSTHRSADGLAEPRAAC